MVNLTPPALAEGLPAPGVANQEQQPGEQVLDRLTRLACNLLRAPVALVVLVREGQPRLAWARGLSENAPGELVTSHPFWVRLMGSQEGVAVEDVRQGAEDGSDPVGAGTALAAWVGVPLAAPVGDGIRCLCVASPQPRAWSADELSLLRDLAALAGPVPGPDVHPPERRSEEAAILDSIPHPCFALDRNWRFTYLNPRAEQFFGQLSQRRGARLLGCNILEECPEVADSTFVRECRQAQIEQYPREAPTYYPGLECWFAVRVSPMPGDGVSVFLQEAKERTQSPGSPSSNGRST